jgi:hypothetical protein
MSRILSFAVFLIVSFDAIANSQKVLLLGGWKDISPTDETLIGLCIRGIAFLNDVTKANPIFR